MRSIIDLISVSSASCHSLTNRPAVVCSDHICTQPSSIPVDSTNAFTSALKLRNSVLSVVLMATVFEETLTVPSLV
jgi:hypothetical protein